MKLTKSLLLASAAFGAMCASEANAQIIRGGGATFPSIAYRNLFDCVGLQVTGPSASTPGGVTQPLAPSCASQAQGSSSLLILYAPVGSGAGKAGFTAHSVTSIGGNNWTAKISGNVPYADSVNAPAWPYANIQFAGSDDPLFQSDVATYNANSGPANFGNILFIPAVVGSVAVSINPSKDGNGNAWNVGSNLIKLSRKSVCGIFGGHITKWDNASITADNGGTAVGAGPITVVNRNDGSGTNFLFTNALTAQCRTVFGANSDVDANATSTALTLYSFPWSDNGTGTAGCPSALVVQGANLVNWPTQTAAVAGTSGALLNVKDQCGNVVATPAGAKWVNSKGNGGIASAVSAINGAISYNTPDVTQAIAVPPAGAPQVAMVQAQYDIDHSTGLYRLPTPAAAQIAMSQANPVFNASVSIADPLNWAAQGLVPNPSFSGAYPYAGFSWFLFYQCYANPSVAATLPLYLNFHYSATLSANILGDNGMAVPPSTWTSNIAALVTNSATQILPAGSGVCSGKSGA